MKSTKKLLHITKERLFNLVAPIHIYHKADIMYKHKAVRAFRDLKQYRETDIVSKYFEDNLLTLKERGINNIDYHLFCRVYNKLFEELVLESIPQLIPGYDYYGAKCFRLSENGRAYIEGDDIDCYPFYADIESFKERIADLKKELEYLPLAM
ncbi:MAG: hypothetical protein K0R54_573 [Clostridiaceae bacterium]|jgi:hypothetical protein|nr:hypothetical protein [Clostridiaceae bacterium]